MRAYLIDEIFPPDMEKIKGFLKENAIKSNLEQIFWAKIPEEFLNPIQLEHSQCRPHVFSVELGADWVKAELFVRSKITMQCTCPGYCNKQQRNYVHNFLDGMIEQLHITT